MAIGTEGSKGNAERVRSRSKIAVMNRVKRRRDRNRVRKKSQRKGQGSP